MTMEILVGAEGEGPTRSTSAVSWAAALAGAAVALAASLILFALGAGLGLAAASPYAAAGGQVAAFTVATGLWLIVTQWLSAGLGGYITGRLRTRWIGTHTDEVFFRDTSHGLLMWAVSTVIVAALAVGAVGKATDVTAKTVGYDADAMFRTMLPGADQASLAAGRDEAARILLAGQDSDADRNYLAAIVAQRTGVTPAEATRRVDAAMADAKAAADKARKASAAFAIFTALSMVIGAFIAAVAAVLGGRLRDEHP